MTVHLIKLCVGVESVDQLAEFQQRRRASRPDAEPVNIHVTRNTPRRGAELLDGGSLYWVIRRQVLVRQPIIRLDRIDSADGRTRCGLVLAPDLVHVEPRPHRPFQGWRYLDAADAPPDRVVAPDCVIDPMPDHMIRDLRELGLL